LRGQRTQNLNEVKVEILRDGQAEVEFRGANNPRFRGRVTEQRGEEFTIRVERYGWEDADGEVRVQMRGAAGAGWRFEGRSGGAGTSSARTSRRINGGVDRWRLASDRFEHRMRAAMWTLMMMAPLFGAEVPVYIGTYTGAQSQGIYVARFNLETGALSAPELAAETANPTFLALHPTGKYLYAVSEVSNHRGEKAGGVSAFSIDPKTSKLTLINQVSSHGTGPCHVSVDRTGRR
jgi:hypothetical protein